MRAYLFVLVAGRQRNFNAFLLEWDQNPMDLQVSFDWIRLPIAVCELSNVAITVTILMKAIWSAAEPPKIDHQVYARAGCPVRSEEHTSELQSLTNLVCRLLLEKQELR